MRVLLVEPDEAQRRLIRDALLARGRSVAARSGVRGAWALLRRDAFSLVLISSRLPGDAGPALCRRLGDALGAAAPPVFALVDREHPGAVAAFLDAGATDCLPLPFDAAALDLRLQVVERRLSEVARTGDGRQTLSGAQQARAEAEALLAITASLGVQSEPESVVRTLVEQTVLLLDAEVGTYAIGADGESIVTPAVWRGGRWYEQEWRAPMEGTIVGLVWRTGRSYCTNDLANDPHTLHAVDGRFGLRSQLTVPVPGDNGPIGLLGLCNSRRPGGFSARDERLLTAVCEYAAAVLRRAHDTAARLAAEREAAQRRREVEALLAVTGMLNRAVDPDDVLLRVAELTADLLDAGRATIVVREEDRALRRLVRTDAGWQPEPAPAPIRGAEGAVCARVFAERRTYRCDDGSVGPPGHAPTAPPAGAQPLLAVPIAGDGRAAAVLLLCDRRDGRPFSDEDVRLVEGIAGHAAVAWERALLTAELRASEERLHHIVETAPDLISVLDLSGCYTYANNAFTSVLGYDPSEVIGRSIADGVHPDDVAAVEKRFREHIARTAGDIPMPAGMTVRVRHAAGHYIFCEVKGRLLHGADSAPTGVLVTARDVSRHKALEEQLTRQAFHDPLTGLPNRALFVDRLTHAVALPERRDSVTAVLFLDLDRFKQINDHYGHAAGDQLLVAVGRRLLACLRPADTVARFGGDEFLVLVEDVLDPSAVTQVAERIIAALQQPFAIDGRELRTATSLGIAFNRPGYSQPEALMREADVALYQAKAAGRGRFTVFEHGRGTDAERSDAGAVIDGRRFAAAH